MIELIIYILLMIIHMFIRKQGNTMKIFSENNFENMLTFLQRLHTIKSVTDFEVNSIAFNSL